MTIKLGSFVEPYLFFSVLSIIMQLFSHQAVLFHSSCNYHFNKSVCEEILSHSTSFELEEQLVQSEATKWNFIANVCFAVLNIPASLIYGSLNDVLGSKKAVLVVVAAGNLFSALVLVLMAIPMKALLLLWACVVFQLISGALGGINIVHMMSNSYASAVVSEDERTRKFSSLESAFMISLLIGPLLSGLLLEKVGFLSAASFAAVAILAALLYSIFILKRPEGTENSSVKRWKLLVPHRVISEMYDMLSTRRPAHCRLKLQIILLICFLGSVTNTGASSLIYVYLRKRPRSFSNSEVGVYLATQCAVLFLGLIILQRLLKRFPGKISDYAIIVAGLLAKIGHNILLAFATSKLTVFLSLCFSLFCGFDAATLRSLLSKQIDSSEQGKVFGVLSAFLAVGYLCGQFMVQPIYKRTLKWFPGFVFVLLSAILLMKVALIFVVRHYDTNMDRLPNETAKEEAKKFDKEDR